MLYLIDGYNLLFALDVLPRQAGPKALENARNRLLGLLHRGFGDESSSLTVVFDAAKAPPGAPAELDYQGIHVVFAVHEEAADDLIELLIRKTALPRHLTVISDDHRIQQAANRRHCTVMSCGDFMDLLDGRRRPQPESHADAAEKPSGGETQYWLKEFADLANDPDLKELFDPYGFLEDPP